MIDRELLLDYINRSGKTLVEIAKYLGISREGLYKKLKPLENGGTEFKASEIYKLIECLGLSKEEKDKIFFKSMCD